MRLLVAGLCGGLAALVWGCGSGSTGPIIVSLDPSSGTRGSQVEISGDNFCGDGVDVANPDGSCVRPPNGLVRFGAARAAVVSWRHEVIVVTVPDTATSGANEVMVVVDGVESNTEPFDVQD